ncbi:MAG TPA: hypothetical protein EYP61_07300 [Candidatus Latescibacteria bacterium]|nr:hypothetical protein [Candidatus Latescibacterota bacterium]
MGLGNLGGLNLPIAHICDERFPAVRGLAQEEEREPADAPYTEASAISSLANAPTPSIPGYSRGYCPEASVELMLRWLSAAARQVEVLVRDLHAGDV